MASKRIAVTGFTAAALVVVGALAFQSRSSSGTTHTYYVAADEVVWDYAPTGIDETTGEPLGAEQAFWVERGAHKIGKVYKKAIYREYTDSTFSELKPRPPENVLSVYSR